SVEGFNVTVVHRLARAAEVQTDPVPVGPVVERFRGELAPIIHRDALRQLASTLSRFTQDAADVFCANGVFPSLNLLQYIVVCLRPIHLASEREKTTRRTCLTSIGSSPMRPPACATWSACGGRRDSSARSARTRAKHGA